MAGSSQLTVVFLLAALALPCVLATSQMVYRRGRWKFPLVTSAVFFLVASMVAVVDAMPSVAPLLARNPSMLDEAELWRALTSLFVNRAPLAGVIFNLTILLGVGAIAEQFFGARRWIAVYFGAGVATEFLALVWEPDGGGNSIAVFGLAGALSLLPGQPTSIVQPGLRVAALAAGAGLLIVRDIHGIGFWAGLAIAGVLMAQDLQAEHSVAQLMPKAEC